MCNLKFIGCLLYARQCAGPQGDGDERPWRKQAGSDNLVQHVLEERRLWEHKQEHLIQTAGWRASQRKGSPWAQSDDRRTLARGQAWPVHTAGGRGHGCPVDYMCSPKVGQSG